MGSQIIIYNIKKLSKMRTKAKLRQKSEATKSANKGAYNLLLRPKMIVQVPRGTLEQSQTKCNT